MTKISIVIQNHLTESMYADTARMMQRHIKFVKKLINMYPDTNVTEDDD